MKKDLVTMDGQLSSAVVVSYLAGETELPRFEQDPDLVAERINAQVMTASSPDDLFGEREVLSARSIIGRPFSLLKVEWRPSDFDEPGGLPVYALLTVSDYDGNIATASCGAASVVRKVAKADAEGWLPLWLKIVEGKKTEAGYVPLDIVKAPAPGEF